MEGAQGTALPTNAEIVNLRALLESLPPELYDDIYKRTLILDLNTDPKSPPKWAVTINKDYKPPVQLQLNREIRESIANTYYGNTIFKVAGKGDPTKHAVLSTWMKSLPENVAAGAWTVRLVKPGRYHYAMSSNKPSLKFQGKEEGLQKTHDLWIGFGPRTGRRTMWGR